MAHPIIAMKMSAGRSKATTVLLRLRLLFGATNFDRDYLSLIAK